jgi:hypothetical protein
LTTSEGSDTYTFVKRFAAAAACMFVLVFPASALGQVPTLNGSISGLTLPMTQNGIPVTHLTKGAYTFSLSDNSGQHSIHMSGPWGAFGYTGLPLNFGTAGPDGVNVPATGTFVFDNIALADGMYRWFCDRHSDMMWGSLTVGNYLSVEVVGRGTVSSFPVDFTCRSNCGVGVPDGSPPVTLVATPRTGFRFDRWETGACSGNGECSVSVNGLMKTRAVFVEIPAGTITGAKAAKARGKRTVTVTLAMGDAATVTTEVRIGTRVIASKVGSLGAGTRTVKVAVPKSAKKGAATVRVTFTRPSTLKAFVETRAIRIPKL